MLSQDNVEPAAPSVILNGKVAPDKPLDIVVDGSSTHWVTYPSIYSSAMAGNPSTHGTSPGILITTHLVGKLTLAGLAPMQRSHVFSIQRDVTFTSVTLSEQQIRQQGLEKVVSGQINASFDKVISFVRGTQLVRDVLDQHRDDHQQDGHRARHVLHRTDVHQPGQELSQPGQELSHPGRDLTGIQEPSPGPRGTSLGPGPGPAPPILTEGTVQSCPFRPSSPRAPA
ncbi:hypothetical protein [Streptomyces sp. NRRL S-337]|uniref:hypothetical protein n=1 Tax=Streptomyces sp. NRRL S-337 TaxID=1463900 RepID=UPI000ACAC009|nr:hypothetical protein [Streptomyces sp. NRRL S-337]